MPCTDQAKQDSKPAGSEQCVLPPSKHIGGRHLCYTCQADIAKMQLKWWGISEQYGWQADAQRMKCQDVFPAYLLGTFNSIILEHLTVDVNGHQHPAHAIEDG